MRRREVRRVIIVIESEFIVLFLCIKISILCRSKLCLGGRKEGRKENLIVSILSVYVV